MAGRESATSVADLPADNLVVVVADAAPRVDHLLGCPAPADRIESYTTKNPAGEPLLITRCIECGGQSQKRTL